MLKPDAPDCSFKKKVEKGDGEISMLRKERDS